jgi:hypothetical protein
MRATHHTFPEKNRSSGRIILSIAIDVSAILPKEKEDSRGYKKGVSDGGLYLL